MKKSPPPRTEKDFTIRSVEWELDIAGRFKRAGFDVPSDESIRTRFWIYLEFLQSRNLTSRIIAHQEEELVSSTALRNSDLTDDGFRFLQTIETKWSNRLLKYKNPESETSFLQKWFDKFKNEKEPNQ